MGKIFSKLERAARGYFVKGFVKINLIMLMRT